MKTIADCPLKVGDRIIRFLDSGNRDVTVESVSIRETFWAVDYRSTKHVDRFHIFFNHPNDGYTITEKKESDMKFKIGDIVRCNKPGEYSITNHLTDCTVVSVGTDFLDVRVIGGSQIHNVRSKNFDLVFRDGKKPETPCTVNPVAPLTVKGHTPKLVIKIGCKEFEFETAEKLAGKLLKVAKAVREADIVSAPRIQDETFTVEEVQAFLAWFKTVKSKIK